MASGSHYLNSQQAAADSGGFGFRVVSVIMKTCATQNSLHVLKYLHISNDSKIGTNQKNQDFWRRIREYFMGNESGFNRSANNLRSHWHRISGATKKFCEIYNRIKAQKRSGWSDEQITSLARQEYYKDQNYAFKYDHMWEIVKNEPKWYEPVPGPSKRTKVSCQRSFRAQILTSRTRTIAQWQVYPDLPPQVS